MARIFISYRREDSAMATGRISDRLAQVFGRQHLFQDIDHIPLGVDFRRTLNQAISESAVMLVIIGRSWVTITDDRGRRRLDDPGDYVRLEVAAALTRGIPVIPVLVEGATMPAESQLPEEIKPLAYRNGVDVRSDMHFPADVEQLIRRLKQVAGSSILPARPALHEERALRYGGTLPKLGRMYLGGLILLGVGIGSWVVLFSILRASGTATQVDPDSPYFPIIVIGTLVDAIGAFLLVSGWVGALATLALVRQWRWFIAILLTAGLATLTFLRVDPVKPLRR